MTDPTIIRTLQTLYEAEHRCPTIRLEQSAPFINWRGAAEEVTLRGLATDDREHLEWLAEMLVERDSAPPPAGYAIHSAGQHYVRLDSLLPQWVRSERNLIAAYQQAAPRLAGDADASRRVARIMSRHGAHLATLESLERAAATA